MGGSPSSPTRSACVGKIRECGFKEGSASPMWVKIQVFSFPVESRQPIYAPNTSSLVGTFSGSEAASMDSLLVLLDTSHDKGAIPWVEGLVKKQVDVMISGIARRGLGDAFVWMDDATIGLI